MARGLSSFRHLGRSLASLALIAFDVYAYLSAQSWLHTEDGKFKACTEGWEQSIVTPCPSGQFRTCRATASPVHGAHLVETDTCKSRVFDAGYGARIRPG
jgi:hypothetical protein